MDDHVQTHEILGGWAARKGNMTAHGKTRDEALSRIEELLRLVQELDKRVMERRVTRTA